MPSSSSCHLVSFFDGERGGGARGGGGGGEGGVAIFRKITIGQVTLWHITKGPKKEFMRLIRQVRIQFCIMNVLLPTKS